MTLRTLSAAAALALALTSPVLAQTRGPSDTGNMAYPAPLPQGNIGTTTTGNRAPTDTGNMAYPAPVPQGNVGNATPPSLGSGSGNSTGSAQYPAPLPQGNLGTTTTK